MFSLITFLLVACTPKEREEVTEILHEAQQVDEMINEDIEELEGPEHECPGKDDYTKSMPVVA